MPVRFLQCSLVCEGPSDRWFLAELLRRAVDEICFGFEQSTVEVVVEHVFVDHQRPAAILERLREEPFDVLLYHHDGAPTGSASDKITEVRAALTASRREPMVPVVPVRETEAWMLCDPDALAAILGVRPVKVAGLLPDRPRDLEAVPDPKQLLKAVRRTATGPALDRQDLFVSIAENLDLDRLRQVPSFRTWWTDMADTLATMGYK